VTASRDDALTAAEDDFAAAVANACSAVAEEFADSVEHATELVAARFSVGRIASMWGARVHGLVHRLLGTAQTAATAAAEDVDGTLPDGWDDLPGRYDDGRTLPPDIDSYVTTTEHLLNAVGDRLAEAARRELAAGIDAGEDIDQLRARLRAAFSSDGAQLGPGREDRVARTEASRAWNTATMAAAQAAAEPGRPVVKQWITRHDSKVRTAHSDVDGQLRLVDEAFAVAGVAMQHPGDPTAPPGLVVNCRCRLGVSQRKTASALGSQASLGRESSDARSSTVHTYPSLTAAGGHTGAMIALVPSEADAAHLALDHPTAEPADELHLTLHYLGNGADWADDHRADLTAALTAAAQDLGAAVAGKAFGAAHWNADSDQPCWVFSIGDNPDTDGPGLDAAHTAAITALEGMHRQPDLPAQHTPWQPHVAAAYSPDTGLVAAMNDRLGPITFDRIRVAFAGDITDIPLGPQEADMADQNDNAQADTTPVPWSTPGTTALAFENQQTGDGRIFAAGSLYWEGGPWPLQHAEEMNGGHQGAELAASIQTIARDGDRITGTGVIYPGREAGADALMLLQEGAPLGVSVDLDDVSMEFIDRTVGEDEQGNIVLLATSLRHASVLPMADGSWSITASAPGEWTASGVALTRTTTGMQLITGPGGIVPRTALEAAFGSRLTAAAGDPDSDEGVVVHSESSGDFLVRITRARLRGATLVAMPAFADARIVLDNAPATTASGDEHPEATAAAGPSEAHLAVVRFVKGSPVPVGARDVAQRLGIRMEAARGHLSRAAKAGRLVRLATGLYVGPITEGPDATASTHGGPELAELEASAWSAMKAADPMPAAWFREPTEDELPPGSGGVHYANGRIFGWVAQAGEPHAGYPGRNLTIESLGELDMTHFLRARFRLDDGSEVRAGAFTMNAPHHRDGAECESAACQFDDTRTVAGIVTVGMSERGLWFSGAAAPWLSEWDRQVFAACQPSYHMKQGSDGRWQLRAVLSVPVPGHSSPLLATAAAVAERSNLALAASAAADLTDLAGPTTGHDADTGADTTRPGTGTPRRAAGGQGGHRPDTGADARVRASSGAALADLDVDQVATSLLTSVPFLDTLLTAMDRRAEQREAARREAAELAASVVAPARSELAASHTTTNTGEGGN
jgi:hypothetical protein